MHQIPDLSVSFKYGTDENGKPQTASLNTRQLIAHMVRSGRQFNSDYSGIRMGERIQAACELSTKGPITLDSQDWETLCEAVKTPSPIAGTPAYPLSPASKCVPLVAAILEAKKAADPKPKRR